MEVLSYSDVPYSLGLVLRDLLYIWSFIGFLGSQAGKMLRCHEAMFAGLLREKEVLARTPNKLLESPDLVQFAVAENLPIVDKVLLTGFDDADVVAVFSELRLGSIKRLFRLFDQIEDAVPA
jgi:hypothetical protein